MKKLRAFLLFELFLSFTLSAILLLMLYQIYTSVQKTFFYINNEGVLDIQKNVTVNNISSDIMQIIFPAAMVDFYKELFRYLERKEDGKKEDSLSEAIRKQSEYVKFFFPSLQKEDKNIVFCLISARELFGNRNGITKIKYAFKKRVDAIRQVEYYSLFRQELYYDENLVLIKEGREHILIPILLDVSVKFFIPDVSLVKKDKKNMEEKEKNNFDGYYQWIGKKKYIVFDEYNFTTDILNTKREKGDFLSLVKFLPYTIHIKGMIATEDFSKKHDFEFYVDFPCTDAFLQEILSQDQFSESMESQVGDMQTKKTDAVENENNYQEED